MSHAEMYVPGIPMPEGLSEPRQRLTLERVLSGTFSSDTQPPGYYVMMLAWTKLFGVSLWALRLPSVILGILSIGLLAWLGKLIGDARVGWAGAALLAWSGVHVFWSQIARMYAPGCFLGLAGTVVMILLCRGASPKRVLVPAYAGLSLMGLATTPFYWPFFLTQMLWAFLNAVRESRVLPGLCRIQIVVLILASPLLATAAYQSSNAVAGMSRDALLYAGGLIQYGFLLPIVQHAPKLMFPLDQEPYASWYAAARIVALLMGLVALYFALRRFQSRAAELHWTSKGPGWRVWLVAAILATAVIQVFVIAAHKLSQPGPNPTIRISQILVLAPVLIGVAGILLQRYWERVSTIFQPVARLAWVGDLRTLVLAQVLIPFALVAVSSQFRPLLITRGLLLYVPYILMVLAMGIVYMARRHKILAALYITLLVLLHVGSLAIYVPAQPGPGNFGEFATKLLPELQQSDVVLLRQRWDVTPVLYYLKEEHCRLVELGSYPDVLRDTKTQRVWFLFFYSDKLNEEMKAALDDFELAQTVGTGNLHTYLFERRRR